MTDSQLPTEPQANDEFAAQGDTRKRRPVATILAVVGLCVAALAAGLWFSREEITPPPPAPVSWQDPTQLAPSMKLEAAEALPSMKFTTMDGREITMAQMKGRPMVLNFWATWCPPCVKEMPALDKVAQDYEKHGLVVIVASLDTSVATAKDYLLNNRLGTVRPVMDGGSQQFSRLKNAALPVTLLVKRDGTLAERLDGFHDWNKPELRAKVDALLAE
jgi:thiol-disulfide isomerase/thioredoxin